MVFWLTNIFIPLVIGSLIYCIFKPESYVSMMLYGVFNCSSFAIEPNFFTNILKNYFCDICWSYSLVFSCALILKKERYCLYISMIINVFLVLFIETCQLTSLISGTFDWNDIILQCLSGLFAAWIIKINKRSTNK